MLECLKLWANQLIVAIIIAVIFELIIPNSKNKKYIKMVINLYVLFVLINPIISKLNGGNNIDLSEFNYKNYLTSENSITASVNSDSENIIRSTFEKKIKEDIKNKLLSGGYNVTSISINMNNSDSEYGKINSVKITLVKNINNDILVASKENNSSIKVNEIEEINIDNKTDDKDTTLRKKEVEEIKKIISEEYNISKENIEVN